MENSFHGKHQGERSAPAWPSWYATLRDFRTPSAGNALWQLANTLIPYCLLWWIMVLSIQRGSPYWVTLVLAFVASLFLVRLFIFFHDCVHGSFFSKKGANTFWGHVLGVFVFTPFDDWRFSHLRHHASYADLDARGFGDIWTMTLTEYQTASKAMKLSYRLYRNPLVLFGFGAVFSFLLRFRLPARMAKRKARSSVLLTDLLIVVVILTAARMFGFKTYLLIQLPVIWFAGMMGIWLFYVQHQFEGVYWARRQEWDALRAAMEGSSYYALPAVMRWLSGNIGFHHVHHLSPRIPNYRLKRCCEAVPALKNKPPLTVMKSLSSIRLKLWDEEKKQLVGFP